MQRTSMTGFFTVKQIKKRSHGSQVLGETMNTGDGELVKQKCIFIESRIGHLGLDLVQSFCKQTLHLLYSLKMLHPLHLSFLHYTILEGESMLHLCVQEN
jgi:hypothetical protein